jgi:hypothetical protein
MADAWSFDPVRLGQTECDAWVAYYRHEWRRFLGLSLRLVHLGFGMTWPNTLTGAWLVLRANQVWAPYPDNDPERAREYMRRFYALVAADGQLVLNPAEAARREVEWWRIHRVHQRDEGLTESDLARAVAHLYSYVYDVAEESVDAAARLRVDAMRLSDAWVDAGCELSDPRLADERTALVASYTELRDAIDRRART